MIRHAAEEDIPAIRRIVDKAREYMRGEGNKTQWGHGYPSDETILADIAAKNFYVMEKEGRPYACFAFIVGRDDTYSYIEDGSWISDEPYGTIHRLASDGSERAVFKECLDFCGGIIPHLRGDTHKNNKTMLRLLKANGFKRCGVIYVHDGTPREAFERI